MRADRKTKGAESPIWLCHKKEIQQMDQESDITKLIIDKIN